jgi:hypothetical protein
MASWKSDRVSRIAEAPVQGDAHGWAAESGQERMNSPLENREVRLRGMPFT